MLRPLIAGNWKMHKTASEARVFAEALFARLEGQSSCDIRVYPAATSIQTVADFAGDHFGVGAQSVHQAIEGAYTGESSAAMVKDVGATSTLVGHSERRQLFGESDEDVAAKVNAAATAGLDVIICIGETLPQREAEEAEQVVQNQVEQALVKLENTNNVQIDFAYEPVWAIGTGKTATAEQAQAMHAHIRQLLGNTYPEARILYGGSVKPSNAAELLAQPDIQGVLVGGASLDVDSFMNIIEAV